MKQIVLLIAVFVAVHGGVLNEGRSKRSSPDHGNTASTNQFPYQAQVTQDTNDGNGTQSYFCAGSIINPQWILTAASCVNKGDNVTVRVGTNRLRKGGLIFRSSQIFVHKHFSESPRQHDIALIKLPTKININSKDKTVAVIKLESRESYCSSNRKLIISGWASVHQAAETQLFSNVDELTNYKCVLKFADLGDQLTSDDLVPSVMCVNAKKKEDFCAGDLGGALTTQGKNPSQVGIASDLSMTCKEDLPGVFTRVALYHDWLKMITNISF